MKMIDKIIDGIGAIFIAVLFLILLFLVICVWEYYNKDAKWEAERQTATYFVPDPIAAKEGETQWLQFKGNKIKETSDHHTGVFFEIDNMEYYSNVYFIEKEKN